MWQHVLAVGNDELAVGDDDDTSLEVAKGGAHAGRLGKVMRLGLVEEWDM